MSSGRLRDLVRTVLGDDDDTPADNYERRAMAMIARRTRHLLAATMTLCALALLTSACTLLYLLHLQPRRDQAKEQREETLEAVRQIRAALHAP